MAPRILLAEDGTGFVAAVVLGADAAGASVEACPVGEASARLAPEHAAAIVRGNPAGRAVLASLRAARPDLPLVALFHDEDEAGAAGPDVPGADGAIVGPLTLAAVAGAVRMALRLGAAREAAARASAPAPNPPPADGLELLKRIIVLEVKRSRRYRLPVSILIVALDGWPERATGLDAGARATLLAGVLGKVTGALRDIDLVAPFPDDRFVVLLPHTGRDGAMLVAGRMVSRLRAPDGPVPLTGSVGVATHEGEADVAVSFAGLVKRAAESLSMARAAGGDQAASCEPARRRERIVMG